MINIHFFYHWVFSPEVAEISSSNPLLLSRKEYIPQPPMLVDGQESRLLGYPLAFPQEASKLTCKLYLKILES